MNLYDKSPRKNYKSKKGKKTESFNSSEKSGDEVSGRKIQWFPGHMAKTKKEIIENLKLVDIVVEIVDARIPFSSRNPDFDGLVGAKPRLILLNKMDMANADATRNWVEYFTGKNIPALAVDCKNSRNLHRVLPIVRDILKDDIARWNQRGMVGRASRLMIVGIPNSGKSSFINKMAKKDKARVEDRPGVTRDKQWYVMEDGTQMLDTPGVLWPKFNNQKIAKYLAFTGAIRDDILDIEELACAFLIILKADYYDMLKNRYDLSDEEIESADSEDNAMLINPDMACAWQLLQLIGKKRSLLIAGGEIDTRRAAIMLLDEFRGGVIGRITLESPNK